MDTESIAGRKLFYSSTKLEYFIWKFWMNLLLTLIQEGFLFWIKGQKSIFINNDEIKKRIVNIPSKEVSFKIVRIK
jgi:protein associated with RNAse G/E